MNNESDVPKEREIELVRDLEEQEERMKRQSEAEESARARVMIQKVPDIIKLGGGQTSREHYFTPSEISIGPIHAGNEKHCKRDLKLRMAARFVVDSGRTRGDLFSRVNLDFGMIKKCFEDSVVKAFDDHELLSLLFLDACFVLQFIDDNIKFGISNGLKNSIRRDMFLLENQLPWSLLKILINCSAKKKELVQSILAFISMNVISPKNYYLNRCIKRRDWRSFLEKERPVHLLDLLRTELLYDPIQRSSEQERHVQESRRSFRNVQDLKTAGIEFRPSKSSTLYDVSFSRWWFFKATLRVPALIVESSTASKLLNLVAFEMCPDNYNCDFAVSSYLTFMDLLVDTEQDVHDLRVAHVLRNHLGSDHEVANLFNDIGSNLVATDSYKDVQEQTQKHYESKCARSWAQCCQDYFSTPWKVVAWIGAALVLASGMVSAFFAVYPKFAKDDK